MSGKTTKKAAAQMNTAKTSATVAKKAAKAPRLAKSSRRAPRNRSLASRRSSPGGNPQIAKADGDAPVQAFITAMPGWKRDAGRLDALIARTVPDVRKALRWTRPSTESRARVGSSPSRLDSVARQLSSPPSSLSGDEGRRASPDLPVYFCRGRWHRRLEAGKGRCRGAAFAKATTPKARGRVACAVSEAWT